MNNVMDVIKEHKLIAIVRGIAPEKINPLAKALIDGGIHAIEITYNQSNPESYEGTLSAISELAENFQEQLVVGAGTVMSVKQVDEAAKSGAKFILSPNCDYEVIKRTKELGLISIPGATTATEIVQAYDAGADIVKVFPAGVLGGKYIKAIRGPLNHIPIMAVGSINIANCKELLNAGAMSLGIGGDLVKRDLINEGRFNEITELAEEYVDIIRDD